MRVRATCLPVLRLAGLFQGESTPLWSVSPAVICTCCDLRSRRFPQLSSPSRKGLQSTAILPFAEGRALEFPDLGDLRIKGEGKYDLT